MPFDINNTVGMNNTSSTGLGNCSDPNLTPKCNRGSFPFEIFYIFGVLLGICALFGLWRAYRECRSNNKKSHEQHLLSDNPKIYDKEMLKGKSVERGSKSSKETDAALVAVEPTLEAVGTISSHSNPPIVHSFDSINDSLLFSPTTDRKSKNKAKIRR